VAGLRSILRLLWEILCPYEIRWGTEQTGSGTLQESEMHSMKHLNVCTGEELQRMLAALLSQARGEVLNEAEMQEFWQVYQEIQRRRPLSDTAA
jgi:hypothetical protein